MSRRISTASLLSCSLLSFLVAPAAQAGLRHHWRLDETGGLTAADTAGGADGLLGNFEQNDDAQWVDGQFDGGLNLGADATYNNYVDAAVPGMSAAATGGFTIAMWLNPGSAILSPGEYQLLSTPGDAVGFTIMNNTSEGVRHDRVLLFWDSSLPNLFVGTTILEPGTWYHVAITSTGAGGERQFYVNGNQEDKAQWAPSLGGFDAGTADGWQSGTARIGAIGGGRTHDSIVDDVRIYNRALTPEEMQEFVAALPVAKIVADRTLGPAPLMVAFDGGSSTTPAGTTITSYAWDFGDGGTGVGQVASHTFAERGRYQVTLLVENSEGLASSASITIDATFACGDTAPCLSADVGSPVVAGCARRDGDCLVVFGGGKDIGVTLDELQFLHEPMAGDTILTANIAEIRADQPTRARAGLMLRQSLDPDSAFAGIFLLAGIGGVPRVVLVTRAAGGQGTATTSTNVALTPPAAWLRLERKGDELTGSYSADGQAWTPVKTLALGGLPAQLLGGATVSSRDTQDSGTGAVARFCSLDFCGSGPSEAVFHRGDADQSGRLNITDALQILGHLFLGAETQVPRCLDAADADDSGGVQITDAVGVLGFLFLGDPPPGPPGPPPQPCGPDPTLDAADCKDYAGCP